MLRKHLTSSAVYVIKCAIVFVITLDLFKSVDAATYATAISLMFMDGDKL